MVNDALHSLKMQGINRELPTSPEDLLKFLESHSIKYILHHHEPVFTVEESHKIDMQIAGTHTRNLFLKDKKGAMFLVTLRHNIPIDLKKLETILAAGRLSFGSETRLWENLGVRAGSVTPFAIINDKAQAVNIIWEAGMMEQEILNFHPLLNSMTVSISAEDLKKFAKILNRTPRILDLSNAAP